MFQFEQGSSRRKFLLNSTAILAATAGPMAVTLPDARAETPKRVGDAIRIGVIGIGVRGKYLIANLPAAGRVVALCDCSLDRVNSALKPTGEFESPLANFAAHDARRCAVYQDYRKMLDTEQLDAVIVATPDHHHVRAASLACQAGLDVYCEKPLSLTIREGRHLADVVARHNRILQVGSQQRTMEVNRFACEFIRSGGLGKISLVELPNYPGPMPVRNYPQEPVPESLDWNLFCGSAPMRPYNRKLWIKDDFRERDLLWRGWDLFRDYSGHMMTNWGGHSVDMVQYALGMDRSGPIGIWLEPVEDYGTQWRAWSDKTPPPDGSPDSVENRVRFSPVSMRYANGTELRFVSHVKEAVFHGEKGQMWISRNKFVARPADLVTDAPDESVLDKWAGAGHVCRPHLANWLDCIVTRHTPNASIEAGHRTATVCHLANIARQLGRALRWNPAAEHFVDDSAANELLDRPRRPGFEL